MNPVYDTLAGLVRALYDRRISTPPVLDIDTHFPGAERFTDAWPALQAEALAIAEALGQVPRFHEVMAQQADISAADGRDWRMFILKAYGHDIPENQARCPLLSRLVAADPDVLSASLSFLAPGKHVPRHRGPFRGVIRYYLGLSVPRAADGSPAAVLAVDDTDHRIGEGEALLWDDTYPHEVWNRSDAVRIALLLDIRRHGMPLDMEYLTRVLIGGVRLALNARGHRQFVAQAAAA